MERSTLEGGGGGGTNTAASSYYDRMDYTMTSSSNYQSQENDQQRERNRDRNLRTERDNWRKAVDDFIDERRVVIRDRSPQRDRDRGRDRDWKDKRRDSRERDRDKRGSGSGGGRDYSRGSPRDDDVGSNSSGGRYNRENSGDSFKDYQDDSDDNRDYQRKSDRWHDGDDDKPSGGGGGSSRGRGNDLHRDDDRKWGDKGKDSSRDGHGSSSRYSRNHDDRKRDDYSSKGWTNEDSYDSSETRDSGEYESSRRSRAGGDYSSSNDFDKMTYKDQAPNRTIIIRGLAQHITESDIWQDTVKCNLVPKDIRLIRRKDTGTSRGFAFVEFLNTSEAVAWMEMKQGELMLKDHYRAVMQYSLQRMENGKEKWISDWHCKCSAHNFKRRDFCYKCGCTRQEGELMEGYEEVCPHPTYTVLLRGLDALTTEENVLQSIQSLSSLPIRSVEIGRDPVTNTSRGVCYLKMNSVVDAVYLHNALLMANPVIDGKQAVVSYCRLDPVGSGNSNSSTAPSSLGSAAIAAAHWSHQKTSNSSQYTLDDVNRLAEYSANLYATNPTEKSSYLAYYQQYYQEQISKGKQISLPSSSSLTGAPTVGNKSQTDNKSTKTPLTEPPNGSGEETYPVPDVSTYQYDKSSGYYYDPYTTLYYDANSQYYYNQKIQTFLYWDSTKSTYLPAPTVGTTNDANKQTADESAQKEEELKKAKEKEKQNEKDKVKVAKRIAKDMEKWAKTLNHKKEIARQNLISAAASQPSLKAQGAADIGFAVLERKDLPVPTGLNINSNSNDGPVIIAGSTDTSLVAAYGQGSDSEDDPDDANHHLDDKQFTDWNKLACLLCKRQFPSKDVLIKHQQLSDLHKQNLEQWYKSRGLDPSDAQQKTQQYRDRAKERRLKYGEPDQPQPNRLKETYMKAREATVTYEEPTKMGLGSDNLGNKLLQKMGWQEGMGLGKKNQGRTSIIETERRIATAGLGTKSQGVVPGPGETYKDCVKKMMKIRYQEIEEKS
ncbi:RNA-binding protein 5 [Lycorma delicatula]|uniref:RNA-binding protein 5 n=1 Tax=Lycorma delicatula TaxID=130591 RepID=UPI003F5150C2